MNRTKEGTRHPHPIAEAIMFHAGKLVRWFLGALALLLSVSGAVSAAVDEPYRTADGVQVYLGVMPAALLRAHPEPHHERKMHGGAPADRDEYHLLVAVFDQASGTRIENAKVEAEVATLGLAGARKQLEAMTVAGAVTYGDYFEMERGDLYRIRLWIARPGVDEPVQVEFSYDLRER